MIRLCALALMFWPVGVFAQTEAAEQARRAMADLKRPLPSWTPQMGRGTACRR